MQKHKKVIDNIISLLKERGASAVVLANIADVVVDEEGSPEVSCARVRRI